MKQTRIIPILCILAILISGCTHNDGDIGPLFGNWDLLTLTADGEEQQIVTDTVLCTVWSFQQSVIFIRQTMPHNDYRRAKGMWSRTDDILTLDFDFHDIDGYTYYTPPADMHLTERGQTPLAIIELDNKNMHLRHTTDSATYDYYLRKIF